MKLYILQHEDSTSPGTTLEWCQERDIQFQLINAALEPLPELRPGDGVLLLGGSMNVDEEDQHPWMKAEKAFIKAAVAKAQPLLGICLGGQLLAESLGARVSRHHFSEKGFEHIHVSDDSSLPDRGTTISTLQWHQYSFDIPTGAEHLFSGDRWASQGYRYNGTAYGVQFHPEADATFVKECYEDLKMKIPEDSDQRLQEMRNWYFKFLDSVFLKRAP